MIQIDIKPITNEKKKKIFSKKNKNKLICHTIKNFIENFPDLIEYEQLQDLDIIDLIKEMNIPQKLNEYFNFIKKHLLMILEDSKKLPKAKQFINKNNFNNVYNKIYDYIMEQLNDKLFPKETGIKDIKISQNCYKLSWVEPSHLIKFLKNYILDYYLPDAVKYFKKIDEKKSPRKKIICINEIYNCIYNLGKFNDDNVEGADEELPLLNYTSIKANPENIYNNCRYISLFIGNQKNRIEGNKLLKLLLLCESIEKIKYQDLIKLATQSLI